MDARQKSFVGEFGNLYAAYGFKRLHGLVIGLLLSSETPLCLDDIARLLNRSKGLISETARRLNSLGYIKKADGPESRKDYYIADADIFINVFHFNAAVVRKNLDLAESFLHKLDAPGSKGLNRLRQNLLVMLTFYKEMSEWHEDFEQRWNKLKNQIPSR